MDSCTCSLAFASSTPFSFICASVILETVLRMCAGINVFCGVALFVFSSSCGGDDDDAFRRDHRLLLSADETRRRRRSVVVVVRPPLGGALAALDLLPDDTIDDGF